VPRLTALGVAHDDRTSDWVSENESMSFSRKAAAIFTDSHFLIPLAVLGIGLAILVALH
jgi:hypothetical protein